MSRQHVAKMEQGDPQRLATPLIPWAYQEVLGKTLTGQGSSIPTGTNGDAERDDTDELLTVPPHVWLREPERSRPAAQLSKRYEYGESIRTLAATTKLSYWRVRRLLAEADTPIRPPRSSAAR